MFKKTFTAAALVIATSAATIVPAAAQQISFGISAGNQQERDLITGGLALFQIANGADPEQVLRAAAQGSAGVIHQEGNGHSGSLNQNGNAAGGVFQYGNNTNANLTQNGGDADLLFVFGW
jgi:minor curlin subunit